MSKKKECPSCAMMIDDDLKECNICGYEFAEIKPVYRWIAIFLIVLFLLYMVI